MVTQHCLIHLMVSTVSAQRPIENSHTCPQKSWGSVQSSWLYPIIVHRDKQRVGEYHTVCIACSKAKITPVFTKILVFLQTKLFKVTFKSHVYIQSFTPNTYLSPYKVTWHQAEYQCSTVFYGCKFHDCFTSDLSIDWLIDKSFSLKKKGQKKLILNVSRVSWIQIGHLKMLVLSRQHS